MYGDWPTLNVAQLFEENRWSVVHKLPSINGQGVVNEVVKPLAISLTANNVHVINHSIQQQDALQSSSLQASQQLQSSVLSTNTTTNSGTGFGGSLSAYQHAFEHTKDEAETSGRDELMSTSNLSSISGHLGQQSSLNLGEPNDYTYYLKTDQDVQWVMEVICYGLSLPISTTEHYETVRDCVHIYCEWMFALVPEKSQLKLIPHPIRDDPNFYFKRILHHLYNIFVPRIGSMYSLQSIPNNTELNMTDIISKQALLCHRVLRTISTLVEDECNLIADQTWESLLLFLLAINDVLLAPPSEREDIGTHLCERVISVLFEIWTIACKRCFPSPSYWKTLFELFCTWRHRPQVIEQWSKVCLLFTQRLVILSSEENHYLESHPMNDHILISHTSAEQFEGQMSPLPSPGYANRIVADMPHSIVSQAWYRLLHTIGDPVDLSSAEIICRTKRFYNFATECVVDPRQHPCLDVLPHNFHKAMKGISCIVDTFLGIRGCSDKIPDKITLNPGLNMTNASNLGTSSTSSSFSAVHNLTINSTKDKVVTPPNSRKPNAMKNISKQLMLGGLHPNTKSTGSSSTTTSSMPSSFPPNSYPVQPGFVMSSVETASFPPFHQPLHFKRQLHFSPFRPKVNSILNIFGNWLFSAASTTNESLNNTEHLPPMPESTNERLFEPKHGSVSFNSTSQTSSGQTDFGPHPTVDRRNSCERVSIELSSALMPENFEAGVAEAIGCLCRLFASKQTDEEISHLYYARFYLAVQSALSLREPMRGQVLSSVIVNGCTLFQLNLSGVNILIPHFLKAIEATVYEKDSKSRLFSIVSIIELRKACIQILLSLLCHPLHFQELPIKDCLAESVSLSSFYSLRPRLQQLLIAFFETETDSSNIQLLLAGLLTLVEDSVAVESDQQKQSDQVSRLSKGDAKDILSRTLYMVSTMLISNWKHDTQVCLAALEVLSALAQIKFDPSSYGENECKRATKWICDYIVNQCSRPPPHHSKDMHSTIVAAYQCLTVWFAEHSQLLHDAECVNNLLEVIELGISGSKSKSLNYASNVSNSNSSIKSSSSMTASIVYKRDKEPKPASMRVRESAEFLLHCLMNQFGLSASAPCPPEAMNGCCDLSESDILELVRGSSTDGKNVSNVNNFKYFISEGSVLLGFLNLSPSQESCVCLIRTPFGKFYWKTEFQMQPNRPNISTKEVARPFPSNYNLNKSIPAPRNFPDSIDKIPTTTLDNFLPTMLDVIKNNEEVYGKNHEMMLNILNKQKFNEQNVRQRCLDQIKRMQFACKAPRLSDLNDIDYARLIVNQLGFLKLEKDSPGRLLNNFSQLVQLDLQTPECQQQIKTIDEIPLRTCDTAFIFYVRKGRLHPQEILNSVFSANYVKPAYLDFLYNVGTPIHCKHHFGWTGNYFTSWKYQSLRSDAQSLARDSHFNSEHGGSIFDGQNMSLYWADVAHELAFLVPSSGLEEDISAQSNITNDLNPSTSGSVSTCAQEKKSLSNYSDETASSTASRNFSDTSSGLTKRKRHKQFSLHVNCDIKVLIIWLESLEDQFLLPIETLLTTTNTGVEGGKSKNHVAILIHPLKNGLFRIKMSTSLEKLPLALPLLDGIVVSKRVLGTFVRQTTINIYRRRRLDAESYQPPHVRRRVKIQDIASNFGIGGQEQAMHTTLLS